MTISDPRSPFVTSPSPVVVDEMPATEASGFQIDFRQLWAVVRRNVVIIAGVMITACALGLIITLLTTPKYQATASVQIEQATDRILNTQDVEPAASYQDADRFLQTQTDILRSRAIAIRVAQELNLFGSETFFRAMDAELPAGATPALRERNQREATLTLLKNNLQIDLQRNSRIATISFTSPNAGMAAKVANAYAQAFIASTLQRKYDSSAYARSFLSRQLADAKVKLESSERALNDYARQAGLIKTGASDAGAGSAPSQSLTTNSLIEANSAANAAHTARVAAEQKWRSIEGVSLLGIPDVLSNLAVQQLLQKRAEAMGAYEQETARHRAEYPTVVQLKAQVDELNAQINQLASDIRSSIHDQYEIALEQERSLDAQVNELKSATLSEQDRSVQYNILAREVDTNRTLYEGLLQRYKEVSAASGVTSNNISIVDQAETPMSPSSPKLLMNLLLALLLGAATAAGFVFVREQMDDAVRVPEDIERKLGLPVLGSIPLSENSANILEELSTPRSPIAEAYHALRAALLYSTPNGLPKTLVITSTQAGEGKSTTSFAIAHELANLGKSIVLVDIDLRRPALHRMMGTANEIGLSSFLTHQADINQILKATQTANLSFISSGPIPPSPSELLSSSALLELIAQLSSRFDAIIFDGPPVLGLADAPILAAVVDAAVLVVEANRGHRGATKSAVRRLRTQHSHLLGGVMTKFDARKSGYSYVYGYDYYDYSDGSSQKKKY